MPRDVRMSPPTGDVSNRRYFVGPGHIPAAADASHAERLAMIDKWFIAGGWQYFAVFALTLIVDVFWTRYTLATTRRDSLAAGIWSAAIVLGGTMGTQIWLANHWVVVASALGAFVGTVGAVRWGKNA